MSAGSFLPGWLHISIVRVDGTNTWVGGADTGGWAGLVGGADTGTGGWG